MFPEDGAGRSSSAMMIKTEVSAEKTDEGVYLS